jgi:hypothetical protein
MPTQHDGQSSSARSTTKTRKSAKAQSDAITLGKKESSKANKVPATGMGR